jgi:hypothetical protein
MKLSVNGSDPNDCKLRADEGLGAIGELAPGNLYTPSASSVFTYLIRMLAVELGYDGKHVPLSSIRTFANSFPCQ